jgi:hypothetical protein
MISGFTVRIGLTAASLVTVVSIDADIAYIIITRHGFAVGIGAFGFLAGICLGIACISGFAIGVFHTTAHFFAESIVDACVSEIQITRGCGAFAGTADIAIFDAHQHRGIAVIPGFTV